MECSKRVYPAVEPYASWLKTSLHISTPHFSQRDTTEYLPKIHSYCRFPISFDYFMQAFISFMKLWSESKCYTTFYDLQMLSEWGSKRWDFFIIRTRGVLQYPPSLHDPKSFVSCCLWSQQRTSRGGCYEAMAF